MNPQHFVSARAAIDHHKVHGCVEHSPVEGPNQSMKPTAPLQVNVSRDSLRMRGAGLSVPGSQPPALAMGINYSVSPVSVLAPST
jgi:hypothetical protein